MYNHALSQQQNRKSPSRNPWNQPPTPVHAQTPHPTPTPTPAQTQRSDILEFYLDHVPIPISKNSGYQEYICSDIIAWDDDNLVESFTSYMKWFFPLPYNLTRPILDAWTVKEISKQPSVINKIKQFVFRILVIFKIEAHVRGGNLYSFEFIRSYRAKECRINRSLRDFTYFFNQIEQIILSLQAFGRMIPELNLISEKLYNFIQGRFRDCNPRDGDDMRYDQLRVQYRLSNPLPNMPVNDPDSLAHQSRGAERRRAEDTVVNDPVHQSRGAERRRAEDTVVNDPVHQSRGAERRRTVVTIREEKKEDKDTIEAIRPREEKKEDNTVQAMKLHNRDDIRSQNDLITQLSRGRTVGQEETNITLFYTYNIYIFIYIKGKYMKKTTFNDVTVNWDKKMLDTNDIYFHWLFPSRKRGMSYYPCLDMWTRQQMRNPSYKERIYLVFTCILYKLFRLEIHPVRKEIVYLDDFRHESVLISNARKNFDRITRMIRFLRDVEYFEYLHIFHNFLMLSLRPKLQVPDVFIREWQDAGFESVQDTEFVDRPHNYQDERCRLHNLCLNEYLYEFDQILLTPLSDDSRYTEVIQTAAREFGIHLYDKQDRIQLHTTRIQLYLEHLYSTEYINQDAIRQLTGEFRTQDFSNQRNTCITTKTVSRTDGTRERYTFSVKGIGEDCMEMAYTSTILT
jgi:hypothetical protein